MQVEVMFCGENINYAPSTRENHLHGASHYIQSLWTFDTDDARRIAQPRSSGIPLGTQHNLEHAGIIQESDNEGLIDGADGMDSARPPVIIAVFEPKLCTMTLATIQKHTSFALSSYDKLKSLRYNTFCTIVVHVSSHGTPPHVLKPTVRGSTSLVRHSRPVTQDSQPKAPEVCLTIPRTTHQSNPSTLKRHCNPTLTSSHIFMSCDKVHLQTPNLNKGLNVVLRGMERWGFLDIFANKYLRGPACKCRSLSSP